MDIISKETLTGLIESCEGTAISIYMPTFVSAREARQNPIRLKNLVNKVEVQLAEGDMGQRQIEDYLAPLTDLIDDESFWQGQDEGLALFLDANELRIFRLPKSFEEVAVVGDAFHITPLIPLYKGNGQYFLLSLDQKRPKLYQGSKFRLARVDELDLPESLQEMFDNFYEFHSHIQFHSKTVNPNPDLAGDRRGMHFGQGGDDVDKNAEIRNYFHRFDEALMDYLDGEDAPLVLAGVGYLHPLYDEVNSYPHKIDEGITKDVDRMPVEDLHKLSWNIVKDKYQTDVDKALGVFQNLADKDGDISENLEEIISAAHYQRIHTLFVAENQHVWGQFDPEKNNVMIEDEKKPENQDLLSKAAAQTLINGGNIFVIPQDQIPGKNEAAAILRY